MKNGTWSGIIRVKILLPFKQTQFHRKTQQVPSITLLSCEHLSYLIRRVLLIFQTLILFGAKTDHQVASGYVRFRDVEIKFLLPLSLSLYLLPLSLFLPPSLSLFPTLSLFLSIAPPSFPPFPSLSFYLAS